MRFEPKMARQGYGVDIGSLPPCSFVSAIMNFAVVRAAKRYRKRVADLSAESTVLREPEMIGVRRLASADQARLPSNEADMAFIANAPRLRQSERALVDTAGTRPVSLLGRERPERQRGPGGFSVQPRWVDHVCSAAAEGRYSRLKRVLDAPSVGCGQNVLGPRIRCAQVVVASGDDRLSNSVRS
jgi:hypothetical protein